MLRVTKTVGSNSWIFDKFSDFLEVGYQLHWKISFSFASDLSQEISIPRQIFVWKIVLNLKKWNKGKFSVLNYRYGSEFDHWVAPEIQFKRSNQQAYSFLSKINMGFDFGIFFLWPCETLVIVEGWILNRKSTELNRTLFNNTVSGLSTVNR